MKIMLAQVIGNYDCKLVDERASRWFTWRSSMLPKKDIMVIFSPRCLSKMIRWGPGSGICLQLNTLRAPERLPQTNNLGFTLS